MALPLKDPLESQQALSDDSCMAKSIKKLKFEAAMERLDEIVAAMESGEVGIEDSIAQYEEAMQLAGHCRKILSTVEQRIKKIQFDHAGEPQAEPFSDPDAEDDEV